MPKWSLKNFLRATEIRKKEIRNFTYEVGDGPSKVQLSFGFDFAAPDIKTQLKNFLAVLSMASDDLEAATNKLLEDKHGVQGGTNKEGDTKEGGEDKGVPG